MIVNCKFCKTDVICNNNINVCTECYSKTVKCQFCNDFVFCDTDEITCYNCATVFCYSCSINEKLVVETIVYDCCADKIECSKRKEKLCVCPFCDDDIFLNCDANCDICNLLFCRNCLYAKKFVTITSSGDYICNDKMKCLKRKQIRNK